MMDKMSNETFGQRLKRIRKERKLTQKEFAKIVGISNQHISLFEREKHTPNIATLEWICKALGVTATEMLGF